MKIEFIILLVILGLFYLTLRYIFDVNIKKLKEISKNEKLDELTKKYPENKEICKWYLRKLNNENVKIEEDTNSNSTLYLVISNKIFIANLNDSFTRIQTIAHECLHSIQSKKMLWFNFIFSNIYLIFFFTICVLAVFKVLPSKVLFFTILLILGFVLYSVRTYLEDDAMTKARFLAKEYMQDIHISSEEEIDEIVGAYDFLNDAGIKCTNFSLLSGVVVRCVVFLVICVVF